MSSSCSSSSSQRRRVSLGGGRLATASTASFTPLRESSSLRSSSSIHGTPSRDRRALLEDWRQQKMTSSVAADGGNLSSKRQRLQENPPLPPTSSSSVSSRSSNQVLFTASTEGTTALDRFRMRKQMSLQNLQATTENALNGNSFVGSSVSNANFSFSQDTAADDDATCYTGMRLGTSSVAGTSSGMMMTIGTPTAPSRRLSVSGSASRSLGAARRRSFCPLPPSSASAATNMTGVNRPSPAALLPPPYSLSQETTMSAPAELMGLYNHHRAGCGVSSSAGLSQQASMSQLTVDETQEADEDKDCPSNNGFTKCKVDVVEVAAMRSQIQQLQKRNEELEKEKLELSIANAPLEARFRQREDEWMKEKYRLLEELEALKQTNRQADDNFHDLKLKYDSLFEEARQLRLQNRKMTSSLSLNSNNSKGGMIIAATSFDCHLQNDDKISELEEKLRSSEDELKFTRLEKVSIEKELHAFKIELESIARRVEELQLENDELAQNKSENRDAEIQLQALTTEHVATAAQLNAVCSDLVVMKTRSEAAMTAMEQTHKQEVEKLQFEISVLKARAVTGKNCTHGGGDNSIKDEEDEAVLKARIEEKERRIVELEAELRKGEELRRQMHNRIQELRGNIRVFVRLRPFLPSDGQNVDSAIDVCPDGESLAIMDKRNGGDHSFTFDKVFAQSDGQDLVFQEVSDFVQSALDGYQVCLFSYGQTGSGKTHTMQGSGQSAMRGIIPRSVEQILMQAKNMHNQKWDFQLTASFLEIYNENLKDLLFTMTGASSKEAPKLAIKRNRDGKSYVEGLTEVEIETKDTGAGMQQLDTLMAVAARARSVASTKMNSQSSRSHSVFMLHIRGYNGESGAEVQGSLNLCDLAGSERLDRSGANDDAKRLRETQSINKSLSCLGDVFNALAQKASHVPYRNSKLTYLLQDCLSGDGKALMFVNLSPTNESSSESLCSLRFAQRVNQIELGKPTKNIQYRKR